MERFDNDVEFTLSSVRQGFDRSSSGRSQTQRSLGVGAHGSGAGDYDRPERLESVRRIETPPELSQKASRIEP